MARVPDFFGLGSETNIATYNYADIVSGTGYIELYGGTSCLAGVSGSAILSNIKFYSDEIKTTGTVNAAIPTIGIDMDFDVLMNKPITLQGMGITNVSMSTDSAAGITKWYPWIKLRKWDGTTETEIANASGSVTLTDSTNPTYKTWAIKMNISPTIFKKDEYLRITVEGYAVNSASIVAISLAHDPMGRTTGWDTAYPSTLIFQLPVRIDV